MAGETLPNPLSDGRTWERTDAWAVRNRELQLELAAKEYPCSDETLAEVAKTYRAEQETNSEQYGWLDDTRLNIVDDPEALRVFYNANCRSDERRSILAAEGFDPDAEEWSPVPVE